MIARSRLLAFLVLVLAAAMTALAPEAPGQTPSPGGQPGSPEESPPVVVGAVLAPRIVLFGDTVRARIDVEVDEKRVDPDSVRVTAAFASWELVGEPERVRRVAGSTTSLRTTYVLRCLKGPCVPSGQSAPLEFDQARVTYTRLGGDGQESRETIRLNWPILTVYSRFASAAVEGREGLATPWRADVLTLPAASHRVAPWLVFALLLGLGAVLTAGGVALGYAAWPRRAPAPAPEPEAPPPPRLTPLQQALALLEDAARRDGTEDRRRSLELVAEALAEWGDEDLARSARLLAWSEDAPAVEETAGLAARVRSTLETELEAAAQEGDGSVG